MPQTPDIETDPFPQEQAPQKTEVLPKGCLTLLFATLPGLTILLVLLIYLQPGKGYHDANAFGYGARTLWFYCLSYSDDSYGHLPPPFRYPDLAGQEEGQVYLDELIKKHHVPKEYTTWLKPGEPYLGHRIAKEPDTNAKPLLSWRAIIHGYECNDEWDLDRLQYETSSILRHPFPRFWEPWNSEVNSLISKSPKHGHHVRGFGSGLNTSLVAIIGPDTGFGDGKSTPMKLADCEPDMILIVESRNSGINWMEPRDFDIRTMPRTINAPDGTGISGHTRYGFHVLFADGEVWRIKYTVPFKELEKFFTLESAKRHDRVAVLGPYVDEKIGVY